LSKRVKPNLKIDFETEIDSKKSTEPKAKKGGLSQLLGKRRCAAEATERIARAANQVCLNIVKTKFC
jgi:hypothetical protein